MDEDYRRNSVSAAKALNPREPSTLDGIIERILDVARGVQEIGHKLNEHADAIFGSLPENHAGPIGRDESVKPAAALDRIYAALDELDRQQSHMARAADRNSTLA